MPSDAGRAVTVRLPLSPRVSPLAPIPIAPRHVGLWCHPTEAWAGIPGSARVGKGRAEAEHAREVTIPLAPCPGAAALPERRPAPGAAPPHVGVAIVVGATGRERRDRAAPVKIASVGSPRCYGGRMA